MGLQELSHTGEQGLLVPLKLLQGCICGTFHHGSCDLVFLDVQWPLKQVCLESPGLWAEWAVSSHWVASPQGQCQRDARHQHASSCACLWLCLTRSSIPRNFPVEEGERLEGDSPLGQGGWPGSHRHHPCSLAPHVAQVEECFLSFYSLEQLPLTFAISSRVMKAGFLSHLFQHHTSLQLLSLLLREGLSLGTVRDK